MTLREAPVPATLIPNSAISSNVRAGSGPGGARVPKNGVLLKNGVLIVPHFCGENYFWPGFFADKNMCQGVPLPQKKKGVLLKICIGVLCSTLNNKVIWCHHYVSIKGVFLNDDPVSFKLLWCSENGF